MMDLSVVLNQNLNSLEEISVAFKCTPKTTLRAALKTLQGAKIGCLVVADGFKVLGIITERDLLMKVTGMPIDLDKETVASFMTKDPVTITRDTSIADAMRLMVTYNFRHLVVADSHSSVIQVVSIKDLCQYVVNSLDGKISDDEIIEVA